MVVFLLCIKMNITFVMNMNILHDCILLYGAFIHFLRSMCSVIAVPLVPVTYFLRYTECKCDSLVNIRCSTWDPTMHQCIQDTQSKIFTV